MTDLERIELCARRTADHFGAQGTHEGALLCEAFTDFADQIAASVIFDEEKDVS